MLTYFAAFEVFFEENLPKLFAHFKKNNLTPDIYLIDWWVLPCIVLLPRFILYLLFCFNSELSQMQQSSADSFSTHMHSALCTPSCWKHATCLHLETWHLPHIQFVILSVSGVFLRKQERGCMSGHCPFEVEICVCILTLCHITRAIISIIYFYSQTSDFNIVNYCVVFFVCL